MNSLHQRPKPPGSALAGIGLISAFLFCQPMLHSLRFWIYSFLGSCLLAAGNPVFGQRAGAIVIGTADSLRSSQLQETRRILVHLPQTPPDDYEPNPRYPVIYVFDGEILFQQIVAITELLSGGSGNYAYPKMMVVGIVNTDRTRDLTPTPTTDDSVMPAFLLQSAGGGSRFTAFLEKELIPYVENKYPAAPYRVLVGHSLGGLLAIDNLARPERLFQSYIALDPSLWWDGGRFLKNLKTRLEKQPLPAPLYVAIANTPDKKAATLAAAAHSEARPETLPVHALADFDAFVKTLPPGEKSYRAKFYPDYDHGTVPLVGFYDALPLAFDFYPVHFPFHEFFQPEYQDNNLLVKHYEAVSRRMGYAISPPGELVDALAHQLMDTKQFNRALPLLELNQKSYPDSARPFEALGDYYQATGNRVQAATYYRQALAKRETPEVKAKLRGIEATK